MGILARLTGTSVLPPGGPDGRPRARRGAKRVTPIRRPVRRFARPGTKSGGARDQSKRLARARPFSAASDRAGGAVTAAASTGAGGGIDIPLALTR